MAPANEFRGVVRIQFDEEEIALKLTLESIRLLESMTGIGWTKLVGKSLDGDLLLDEVISILWAGFYGANNNKEKLTTEECGDFVEKHGVINMTMAMRSLMAVQALGRKRAAEVEDEGALDDDDEDEGKETKKKKTRKT